MKKTMKKFAAGLTLALVLSMFWGIMTMAAEVTPKIFRTDFKRSNIAAASYQLNVPAGQEEAIVPIVIKESGRVYFKMTVNPKDVDSAYLYSSPDCNDNSHVRGFYFYEGDNVDEEDFWLNKGTYYLKIRKEYRYNETTWERDTNFNAILQAEMYEYSSRDLGLSSGRWVVGASTYEWVGDKSIMRGGYYKISIPKAGYIKLEASKDSKPYWDFALYNSKKKQYEDVYLYGSDSNYGASYAAVQKGTYYLKMKNSGQYKFRYIFKADPSKKNYTKKKAITLGRKKTVHNVFYSNAKKSTLERWYKIKVTKKQRITWVGEARLCDSKGRYVSSIYDQGKYYSKSKLKKGTYYLCVKHYGWNFKNKKRTMGQYRSLRWQ